MLIGLKSLARRYPIAGFFILAFGFSWGEILSLGIWLQLPAGLVVGLTTFAPTLASVILTALIDGRQGLNRLLRQMVAWRAGLAVYAVAVAGLPLVYLLATLIFPGALASFRPDPIVHWIVAYAITFIAGGIIGGPLFEEPGWRGFALPRLEGKFGPLAGTLILGVLWGSWHLPQSLIPDWAAQNGGAQPASIAVFLVTVIAISVILTWIYNRSQGSLLVVILAHSSINTTQLMIVNTLFPAAANTEINALIGFGGLALLILVLTRGRLGYQAGQFS
jgi:membrane protease YdiL (CAAX protease family)